MSIAASTPPIQISHRNNPPSATTCQVVTDNFRNEVFETNMEFFKNSQPDIYRIVKNHRCKDYRLCINPDGSANIMYMPEKKLLHYSDGNMNINSVTARLENIPFSIDISPTYAMAAKPDWYDRNPFATRMYQSLFNIGPIKVMADEEARKTFNQDFRSDFIPYLRVYGIGLGMHITRLLETRDIQSILIYEPEIDLFYISLFTTPWWLFFKYLELDPARRFSLIIAAKPDEAVRIEKNFLVKNNLNFLSSTRWQLPVRQDDAINRFSELETNAYQVLAEPMTAGWYEDQKAGLVNCLGNLFGGRKFYTGTKVNEFMRVAVVGAGPSLDDSIDYLKQHRDDFIIFACGTSITPLIKKDIVPDYHVHQERRSDAEAVMSWAGRESYHDITALKLNVVEAGVDELYKDVFIFQKFNDPASALLGDDYPITKNVNPTVTNSAMAFAAQMGANEIYLFGVDYGAASDREHMHADHYVHAYRETEQVDKGSRFTLPGNLGQTIISTDKLIFSHNIAEICVRSFPKIRWFNVDEGALIQGAKPVAAEDMPQTFKKGMNNEKVKTSIGTCFNADYSIANMVDYLEQRHLTDVQEYLKAIREFVAGTDPARRSDVIATLSLLHKAVETGKEINHFMPHKLFSGGIRHFIENINLQNTLCKNDQEALAFYQAAVPVLQQYLDEVEVDVAGLIRDARTRLEQQTINSAVQ